VRPPAPREEGGMSDKLPFRSDIHFETPQDNDRFEGQRVRYALMKNGEIHLAFFNAKDERCTLRFTARDLRAVLDFKLIWRLLRG
jgi:1-deoxy-D-xylulose 5-phosphate reductoisomerase